MSTEIEVNNIVLSYDLSTVNENFLPRDMFNLRTFSQALASVLKNIVCSILHFDMFINSLNADYKS